MFKSIGLDLGNSYTNVVTEDMKIDFPSRIEEGYDKLSDFKRIKVRYDNTDYSVGIGRNNLNKAKYFNDAYKIMFLTAIAKSAKETETMIEANVVIGLPVEQYKNEEIRNRIKEHINTFGTQTIVVDNVERIIKINKFDIWVEGGIMASDSKKYAKEKVIIVDIGGYTRDSLEFIFGEIGKNKTEEYGIISLKNDIYEMFKADYNAQLDEKGKEELFYKTKMGEKFSVNKEIVGLDKYRKMIQNYTSNVFDSLETTYSLSDKKILFIGGGSLELKPFLQFFREFYNFEVLENANFLNAKAYFDYAEKVLI